MVDRMMREVAEDVRADTSVSLAAALAAADIVFTHESFSAESALDQRRPGQQVWMMCHGVTPMSLYTAWSWAVPEADWRSLIAFPDVRAWTDWELGVWNRLDGLVLPCAEAGDSFRQIDPRFNDVLDRARFILSGAAAASPKPQSGEGGSGPRNESPRSEHQRVGLYLGSPEPYRGFAALIAGVQAMPAGSNLTVAVAGPDRGKVPAHPALRALGRVEDVGALLASVDFLINVNRFSLFDLSTIEAVQAGKLLMLHAVGGNRAFERLGAGCVMLRDLEPLTIAECLARTAAIDAAARTAMGQQSRRCWEKHLTPRHMWDRHLALYDELVGTQPRATSDA